MELSDYLDLDNSELSEVGLLLIELKGYSPYISDVLIRAIDDELDTLLTNYREEAVIIDDVRTTKTRRLVWRE